MKRLLGTIGKRGSHDSEGGTPNGDSPEATIARGIRLFCESGGPNNQGEEVLHLPVIVEAAESSPDAAREAANRIRKFLSRDNYQRAYVQYNSIMLVRILADNPGQSFTKNLDAKFTSTVKDLLRDGRDMSVQQILRETLDSFESSKANDETLAPLREMWAKEKVKYTKNRNAVSVTAPTTTIRPGHSAHQMTFAQLPMQPQAYANQNVAQSDQNYFARNHRPRGLPSPHELAQRIEEARTSSKLLLQVVQSTPPNEVLTNELIKEFVERCQSASRSIQGYINSEDPPPDEDTLLTLIETNDQISTALSRYQRAMLQARRMTGTTTPGGMQRNGIGGAQEMPGASPANGAGPYSSPAVSTPPVNGLFSPPSQHQNHSIQRKDLPPQPSHFQSQPQSYENDNPFDDPKHETAQPPADFGLPPGHFQNPSHLQSSSEGYRSRYQPPASFPQDSTGRQEEKGMGGYGGRTTTTERRRVDDSDEEEEELHPRGQERGRPVQYRF
ncbi:MAG: hypothetical protein Q9216_001772 [Gyalolechia sp. 2 TL-2023]